MTDQERDSECLKNVRAGEARALAELYDRYTPLLYSMALRILKTPADAEDAVQDAWVQIWKRAANYDSKRGSVAAWILTVSRTRALDRLRSMTSRGRAESRVDPEPLARPVDPPASTALGQLSERVRKVLGELAPRQRQVLEVAYFEGLSQSEIAQRLGEPLGTVKSWTRQGLMQMRERFPREDWL